MTRWDAEHGDLLDAAADAAICSANPNLNLSGGVGGAMALRFGGAMQQWLREYLLHEGLRHVPPGEAIVAPRCGTPFEWVAHAVAIDAFYDTTPDIVLKTYDHALAQLAAHACKTVAAACLGCGYGRMSTDTFVEMARTLAQRRFEGIDRVVLITTNADLALAVKGALAGTP